MKNVFLVLVLAIFFAGTSVGSVRIKPWNSQQVTPEEVLADIIIRYNAPNGLIHPDSVWPGQRLYYYLPDGSDTTIFPVFGDNQTTIVKGVIDKKGLLDPGPDANVAVYNGEPYDPESLGADSEADESSLAKFWQKMKNFTIVQWLVFLYLLAILIGLIYMIPFSINRKRQRKEWNKDPVKSGAPFSPNGVPSSEVRARITEIVQAQYPGATFVIKSIRRGTLNGQAIVWYDGEPTPKERIFDNVAGYEAITEINSKEERVYCLQGCGNPVRVGEFFKADKDFTFTPDAEIGEDGVEIPIVSDTDNKKVEVELGSESFKITMKMLDILEKGILNNDIHDFTIKNNGFEIGVKYFDPKVKAKNEPSEGPKK